MRLAFVSLLLTLISVVWGLSGARGSTKKEDPISVVVTVPFLADLFGEVTCDSPRFEVETLVPAQLDPHHYYFRPEDRAAVERARLVVSVGRGFENWLERMPKKKTNTRWLEVAEKMKLRRLDSDTEQKDKVTKSGHSHGGAVDVHIWHSPDLVREAGVILSEVAKELVPQDAKRFTSCRGRFDEKVESEVVQIKTLLKDIPIQNRVFVVGHDSMRYFTDYFGFKVFSIAKLYDTALRTPADYRNVVKNVEKTKAKAAYLNTTGSGEKEIERIAKEAKLKIAGKLYIDGPGPKGSGAETVLGMWNKNAEELLTGLRTL